MSKEYEGDVHVKMGFSAGNWFWGEAILNPSPEGPTFVDVSGLNIDGEGEIFYQVSVTTQYPWHTASQPTVSPMEDDTFFVDSYDETGFRIWIFRRNDTPQPISWMVWRNPA